MNCKRQFLILMLIIAGSSSDFLFASDFECVSSVCRVEVLNDKLYETDSLICQVNNRNGERFSAFSIPYSKSEKVSRISAWIEDLKGNRIRDLKKAEFKDESTFSGGTLFQDNRVKTFKMKYNIYPYRVCYTFTHIQSQFNEIVDWQPFDEVDYPISEARLYLSLPKDYTVKSFIKKVPSINSNTFPDKIATEYIVKAKPDISKISDEDLIDFNWPRVVVVPLNFKLGVEGRAETWGDFGLWYETLNQELTKLPETEKSKVSNLLAGITDTVAIVKTLYQYLQDNTRYVGVQIGIGGWKSYPASYVAQNKYGDCKALTNYMKALLELKGIRSNFVLISAGSKPKDFIEELPSSQFNHVLLAVPVGIDTLWLENTESIMPVNYVGTFTQNRKALFVDQGRSHLITMPSLQKRDVLNFRKIKMVLDEKGSAGFSAVFTKRGASYEFMNSFKNYCSEKEMTNYIDGFIPFDNYELKNWKFVEANRDSAKIDFQLNLSIPKLAKMMGNDCYIKTLPIPEGQKMPKPANLPVTLFWPVCNVDSTFYEMPTGYKLNTVPEPVHLSSLFGSYEAAFSLMGNKIIAYKKLEINSGKYSAAEYDILYAFLKSVQESENTNIINLTKIQD